MNKLNIILVIALCVHSNLHAQDLNAQVARFYNLVDKIEIVEPEYKSNIFSFISPQSRLNKDSIANDCYSYWFAQSGIGNSITKFKIEKVDYNKSNDSASVITDLYMMLEGKDKFIYQVKSYWVKVGSRWYFADKAAMNIGVKPDYEDNENNHK